MLNLTAYFYDFSNKMDEIDTEEIYKWIDSFQITRQKKNIHRDFSDAVPLAEILKQSFPKLVDLHNYCSRNSFAQKLNNWITLQRKVLSKLKINLSKSKMESLAKAEPGTIEQVLFQIKDVIKEIKLKEEIDAKGEYYLVEGLETKNDGSAVAVKVKQGNKYLDQKIVPTEKYDEMVKTLGEKEEYIGILKSKVDHLEKLLKLKDERIDDLKLQLNNLNVEIENHPTTRFINEMF